MDFEIVSMPERLVAGPSVRTSNAEEADPDRARLPDLWRRAAPAGDMVAVLTDYESDRDGQFTQVVGRQVDTVDGLPEGQLAARVPAGDYARFTTSGDVPQAVIDSWRRVWDAEDDGSLRRAWRTDFELWPAAGSPEIYISVEP